MEKILSPRRSGRLEVYRRELGSVMERLGSSISRRMLGILFILALGVLACSKEHKSPVSFHRGLLQAPRSLESEFMDEKRIILTWTMDSLANVAGYVVSMSDTTGLLKEIRVDTTAYVEESDLTDAALVDSLWYFFEVSAIDTNLFRGPPSLIDSVLVP